MICRLSSDKERRQARLMFYKDDVFVMAHKFISQNITSLCIEEIFCTAEYFASYLLENKITNENFINYEIDYFEKELEDQTAVFHVLAITFVKLCALRKVKPLAAEVAKALVQRCQVYEGFSDFLKALDNEEHKLILENRRANLFEYELNTINKGKMNSAEIDQFVNSALECSVEVIQQVIFAFTLFNNEMHHNFDKQLEVLLQGYKDKQACKDATKIEMNINRPVGTLVAHANNVSQNQINQE
jgi:hypothetical protein